MRALNKTHIKMWCNYLYVKVVMTIKAKIKHFF